LHGTPTKAKQGDLGTHALTTKARGDIVHHNRPCRSGQSDAMLLDGITHISVQEASGKRSRRGIAVFAPRELSADRHYFYTLSSQRQRAAGRSLAHEHSTPLTE